MTVRVLGQHLSASAQKNNQTNSPQSGSTPAFLQAGLEMVNAYVATGRKLASSVRGRVESEAQVIWEKLKPRVELAKTRVQTCVETVRTRIQSEADMVRTRIEILAERVHSSLKAVTEGVHSRYASAMGTIKAVSSTVQGGYVHAAEVCTNKEKRGQAMEACSDTVRSAAKSAEELAKDRGVQVSAASAAGGAVVVGAGGAATGLAVGSTVGAAIGVLPALFTFGASIPICAAAGGAVGTAMGTLCGGAVGLVGGGAAGYGTYAKRESINHRVTLAKATIDKCAKQAKTRLVGGTGGTMD